MEVKIISGYGENTFQMDDYGICKTCLFRVSHIQNYKILA